jgi:multisubunit Na+/H+ antiporter MnhF subunit
MSVTTATANPAPTIDMGRDIADQARTIYNAILTGNPVASTPLAGDSSTAIATTAFVATAMGGAGGFVVSAGVAGGQTVYGGINASDNLNLSSTSNVTKGNVVFNSTTYVDANGVLVVVGFASTVATKTGNYTLTSNDATIFADATTGAITITLPAIASVHSGRVFSVKKIDSSVNTVTLKGNGAELIDGANTQVITSQWKDLTVKSGGTVWYLSPVVAAGSAGASTSSANTFTAAPQTIVIDLDANRGLVIQRHSGTQSANIIEILDSDGTTVLSGFSKSGRVFAGSTPDTHIPAGFKMVASDASDAYVGAAIAGKIAWVEMFNGQGYFDGFDYTASAGIPINLGSNASVVHINVNAVEQMRFTGAAINCYGPYIQFINSGVNTYVGWATGSPGTNFQAGAVGRIPLAVQQFSSSQTADLFDAFAADGTTRLASVGPKGAICGSSDVMTYASTISLDPSLGNFHRTTTVNATGAATINALNAGKDGQHMWVQVVNDATSGKVITFGTNFKTTGTVTGTASKAAVLHFISDGTNWYEVSRTLAL